jgi:hypothetical protein
MFVVTRIFVLIGLLGGASMLHAQASATATRTLDLKIGGGFTTAYPDYGVHNFNGAMGYFTADFKAHLGVEGDFHFVKDSSGTEMYEKTYEAGVRYFWNYPKFQPYFKGMYGRGVFNFPAYVPGGPHPNLAYNMGVLGAGIDYKALPYLYVRGDYEYQRWFGFPPNGLTPMLITIGVAYHFR